MQTILGAGGAVGKVLAKELHRYTNKVRLVSRKPVAVSGQDQWVGADLTDAAATEAAVIGAKVVYLVAGLPYRLKVWEQQWPVIMQNAIDACIRQGARLVFFDNIYMYDTAALNNMKETAAINPPSRKGMVRKQIAEQLLQTAQSGKLHALIARSADFYGPGVNTSVLMETVYKNMRKGKKPMWMLDAEKIHSFTYVPDAARATALLGNSPDAINQVWHLPTSPEKINGKKWVALFARHMNRTATFSVLSKRTIKLLGYFIPVLKESYEMLYQYDRDYFFNSEKFMRRYPDFLVTGYEEGVKEIIASG
jgi:nucleoside-diphosphate-sugar epimerase